MPGWLMAIILRTRLMATTSITSTSTRTIASARLRTRTRNRTRNQIRTCTRTRTCTSTIIGTRASTRTIASASANAIGRIRGFSRMWTKCMDRTCRTSSARVATTSTPCSRGSRSRMSRRTSHRLRPLPGCPHEQGSAHRVRKGGWARQSLRPQQAQGLLTTRARLE